MHFPSIARCFSLELNAPLFHSSCLASRSRPWSTFSWHTCLSVCYSIRTRPLPYVREDIREKVRSCAWLCVGDWCCLPPLCGNQTYLHEEHTAPAKVIVWCAPHSWPSPWLLPTCVKEQKEASWVLFFFLLGGFNSLSRRITRFSVFSEEYTRK